MSNHSQGRSRSAGIVHLHQMVAETILADRMRDAEQRRLLGHVEARAAKRRRARRLLARLLRRHPASTGQIAAEES
jgi:hypothetical protein